MSKTPLKPHLVKLLLQLLVSIEFSAVVVIFSEKEAQLETIASETEVTVGNVGVDPAIQSGYM